MRVKHFISVFLMLFTLGISSVWGIDASISSFSSTSGNIDANISFASTKVSQNGPTTDNGRLKLLRKGSGGGLGDYVTITAKNSATISSITFSLSSTIGYSYSVNNGSATTGNSNSVAINNISATTIKFQNNSSSQMFVTSISVVYSLPSSCTNSITISKATLDNGSFSLNLFLPHSIPQKPDLFFSLFQYVNVRFCYIFKCSADSTISYSRSTSQMATHCCFVSNAFSAATSSNRSVVNDSFSN